MNKIMQRVRKTKMSNLENAINSIIPKIS